MSGHVIGRPARGAGDDLVGVGAAGGDHGLICRHGAPGSGLGGHGGGEPGQKKVQAAFELGGAVVDGLVGVEAAQDGEFADRQAVQSRAQYLLMLLGVLDDFLELLMTRSPGNPKYAR